MHNSIKSIFIHNQAEYARVDLLLICFSFSIADVNILTYSMVLNVYLTYNSRWKNISNQKTHITSPKNHNTFRNVLNIRLVFETREYMLCFYA